MNFSTDGLVIRETKIKENDKVLTILTRDKGIIRAFANSSNGFKASKSTATGLITYSRFEFYVNAKGNCVIDDAKTKDMFINLRSDIGKLALAQYFCELAEQLAPKESNAEDFLRLLLNSIYMAANDKLPLDLLKCIYELRITSLAGYVPDLVGCRECGCFEDDGMHFLPESGQIICSNCGEDCFEKKFFIGKTLTNVMRHCVYSELNKLFSFRLSENAVIPLGKITEKYCLMHLDKDLKTLEFYKNIKEQKI